MDEACYFEKLEELVADEDQIITVPILSHQLDVSLIISENILRKYISNEIIQGEGDNFSATHLICGKLETGEYRIQIVDSKQLKVLKQQFGAKHKDVVYSLQKSKSVDFNILALAEKVKIIKDTALRGSVVGEECTKRLLESKVLPPPPAQKNYEKQKPQSYFKPVVKTEADTEKKSELVTSTNNKGSNVKKVGGLTAFFSQSTNNGKKQQISKSFSDDDVRETKRPRLENSDCQEMKMKIESKPEKCDRVSNSVETNSQIAEETKETVSKKVLEQAKKGNDKKQEGKKRKRIILQSDSEDDIFGNDEDQKMDVHSEEEKSVITQPKEIIPKNKKRKAIEKVYTDDEGFVVTRTEYALVSASEDEEDEVKEENSKAAVKLPEKEEKKSPPARSTAKGKKGKSIASNQTTLMSFFKKK